MSRLPDPLALTVADYSGVQVPRYNWPLRMLSDRGIRQAVALGLIKVAPCLGDDDRIQPATLDLSVEKIRSIQRLDERNPCHHIPAPELHMLAGCQAELIVAERISFLQDDMRSPMFFRPSADMRSGYCRLGGFVGKQGIYGRGLSPLSDLKDSLWIGNYGPNDFIFERGDRVPQLFFYVEPFADFSFPRAGLSDKEITELGDKVRSLEMGVQITSDEELQAMVRESDLKILPTVTSQNGWIIVHASEIAYRIRKLDHPIAYKDRKKFRAELMEPIDISKGYEVKRDETVVIQMKEKFRLSPRIGIRFWDSLLETPPDLNGYRHLNPPHFSQNMNIVNLSDGWFDPGYEGIGGRQPKGLAGRIISPGDPIGFGQVFFFPKGVERPYGSDAVNSSHQGKTNLLA
ncbi:hypothetical protein J4464_04080 [Candidatus Woesearchaeota archaeon]|nr:hypothetical protein [Candidatus Woesearchaeota archaeon]